MSLGGRAEDGFGKVGLWWSSPMGGTVWSMIRPLLLLSLLLSNPSLLFTVWRMITLMVYTHGRWLLPPARPPTGPTARSPASPKPSHSRTSSGSLGSSFTSIIQIAFEGGVALGLEGGEGTASATTATIASALFTTAPATTRRTATSTRGGAMRSACSTSAAVASHAAAGRALESTREGSSLLVSALQEEEGAHA